VGQFLARIHHTAKEPHRLMLRHGLIIECVEQSGEDGDTRLIPVECGHEAIGDQPLQLMTRKRAGHMNHGQQRARLPSMRAGHTPDEKRIEGVCAVEIHDRFSGQDAFAGGIQPQSKHEWMSIQQEQPVFGMNTKRPESWFNPGAFSTPAAYTFGNVGRNTVYGPGLQSLDVAISRSFALAEQARFTFRLEAFNSLNKVNLGTPNRFVNTAQFGTITESSTPGRVLQLSLRLTL